MKVIKRFADYFCISMLSLMLVLSTAPVRAMPLAAPDPTQQPPLNVVELVGTTLANGANQTCMRYSVVGICVFLTCKFFGCWISTSILVTHSVPDGYVEVMHDADLPPSDPTVGALYHPAFKATGSALSAFLLGGGGRRKAKFGNKTGNSLSYHDAMVIGNPALLPFDTTIGTVLSALGYCRTTTLPYTPYFHSYVDLFAWRIGSPIEIALAAFFGGLTSPSSARVAGGVPFVGGWADLMSRTGYVTNNSPYQSAASTAIRASSVVADWSIPGVAGMHTSIPMMPVAWGSWPFPVPNTELTMAWSLQYPRTPKAAMCLPFVADDTSTDVELAYNITNPAHSWAYVLWRPFLCCNWVGAKLISII